MLREMQENDFLFIILKFSVILSLASVHSFHAINILEIKYLMCVFFSFENKCLQNV